MTDLKKKPRFTAQPDITGFEEKIKAWKATNDRVRKEALEVVASFDSQEATRRRPYEERILFNKLSKPTYQCARGHLHNLLDDKAPPCCGKCGCSIVEKCECGASLLLTYSYEPPYRRVDCSTSPFEIRREVCFGCSKLYPWALFYLFRPSESIGLTPYETALLAYVPEYPERGKFMNQKEPLLDLTEIAPVNVWHRIFGGGVNVSDPRHPKHKQWSNQVSEIDKDYAFEVERFTKEVLRYRQDKHQSEIAKSQKHDYWRTLSGREFEEMLAALLRRRGMIVRHVGGSGDEGADLIIESDRTTIVVQCKAFNKPVGPGPVRDLYGALLHHKAEQAWLVSLEGFTTAAIKFAAGKPIQLLPIASFLNSQ